MTVVVKNTSESGTAKLNSAQDGLDLSLFAALRILFNRLSPSRRRAFVPLMALMLVGAFAEVVTIGAVVPLLALIASPADEGAAMSPMVRYLGSGDQTAAVYVVTGLFALAALIAAVLRLALLRASNRFVYGVSYDLGVRLYSDTLLQPYTYHTRHNSSEIIASINNVQIVTNNVLIPLMNGFIAVVIGLFIVGGLVVIDPVVALVAGVGCAAIYLVASVAARRRLRRNSAIIAQAQGRRVQAMQEGLGGIRDVLLDRLQPVFIETYEQAEADYRDARTRNAVLAGAPRFVVEALGMVLIALVAVVMVQGPGGLAQAIPVLGALALGAQRLLPLIQLAYNGWALAMGNRQVLNDVVQLLSRPMPEMPDADIPLSFERTISLDSVDYAYPGGRGVTLNGVNLEIAKGARVGIAGKTGSGKSTLMDLVLSLLEPTAGELRVDGVKLTAANRAAWQKNIAHVPQAIYLADTTIAENIAFGVRPAEIDRERVRRAAEQAELAEVIAALPDGYDTRVGERGIQLSGGQRQRIGIARALYKQARVLVFDEATSALDTETESAVMAAIERLDRNLTILIIAHRLSTLEACDMVVRLEKGRVLDWREAMSGERKQYVPDQS
ncbi:ABC-type multidrug transport system fused ATPase/permease subunit [Aquamicrobium defluvii]|uniref:ABC-type multidrug transport system fused ATPase/permease subunit n=1 Tax=Aquamicrobium defluvii TaxID=69279 RepID=A0A4R6YI69_9HYPH|nr:ABC transporter ATP-binding protein [Halopseudomonas bauzanensis]TDR36479.1 ABC-type multidrug transport system fused ATPase/permease subunit [Aquamicrobium defluvii]